MKSPEAEHEPNPCVYLVFSQGIVKIGRTINLENRVSSLKRAEYPEGVKGFGPIEEILYIKTEYPMRLESMIHSLLEPEHVTGEWFHLKQDDIRALQSLFDGSIGQLQNNKPEELRLKVYDNSFYDSIPTFYVDGFTSDEE